MVISDKDIKEIGQFVINELAKELIKQDHKATGNLISSLDYSKEETVISTDIVITMNDYGKWVNLGRKRGAAKVPIQALVKWIKQKGIETNNKKVLGMAFAIQKTIEKQGIPTANSRKRGKRVEFVDDTLARITNQLNTMIAESVYRQADVIIDNFIQRL